MYPIRRYQAHVTSNRVSVRLEVCRCLMPVLTAVEAA